MFHAPDTITFKKYPFDGIFLACIKGDVKMFVHKICVCVKEVEWSDWSECFVTCGTGKQSSVPSCRVEAILSNFDNFVPNTCFTPQIQ